MGGEGRGGLFVCLFVFFLLHIYKKELEKVELVVVQYSTSLIDSWNGHDDKND